MSNDLHHALDESTETLTLDRSVTDIVARGDRIRRGRRRIALGGAAAVVAGAAALSVALPQGSSPMVPSAQAAWGPNAVNLAAGELDAAGQVCREEFAPAFAKGWTLPADVPPIAADERNGLAELVYVHDGVIGTCSLARDGGGYAPRGGSWDEVETLGPGIHLGFITMTGAIGTPDAQGRLIYSPDGPVSQAVGILQASDEVKRVEVTVAGTTVEAAVHEGFVFFWLPDGHPQSVVDAATVVAYDSEGSELELGSSNLFNQPPVPADGGRSITDEEEGRF